MLPDQAGIEPATLWSSVGRASNWATKAGNNLHEMPTPIYYLGKIFQTIICEIFTQHVKS